MNHLVRLSLFASIFIFIGIGCGLHGDMLTSKPVTMVPVLISFGDSITQHYYATDPGVNDYVSLLATDLHLIPHNFGLSGDQAADMSLKVTTDANPADNNNPVFTTMIGLNDSFHYGYDPDKQITFQNTLMAALAWLALPRSQKIFGQDKALSPTGKWNPDNTIAQGLGVSSSTQGNALQLSMVTIGAPIYLAYKIQDGNSGTASVMIDGMKIGTLCSCGINGSLISTINSPLGTGIALARYPVPSGPHTVKITVTSTTSPQNTFFLEWIATRRFPAWNPPSIVYVGQITRQQNDTNEPANQDYDSIAQSVVSALDGDGLAIHLVPTRDYMNTTTDMHDTLHPNNVGHSNLRFAFEAVMNSNSAPHNP